MMEFLGEIKDNAKEDLRSGPSSIPSSTVPTTTVTKTEIEYSAMINILIMHSQSQHVTLQVLLPNQDFSDSSNVISIIIKLL